MHRTRRQTSLLLARAAVTSILTLGAALLVAACGNGGRSPGY